MIKPPSIYLAALTLIFLLPVASSVRGGVIRWSEPANCAGLNTSEDEFAPCWNRFEDQLYFNSNYEGYSYFYTARLADSMGFDSHKQVPGSLNRRNNNQSYITFSNDEEAFLSTFKLYKSRSYLNIYRTYRKKQIWSAPILDDSLASESFNSHPTVSPDGRLMIFSTDRNSEFGDTDLWMTARTSSGGWSAPVPLNELNSPGNEITPYLASDDTLFFATNGQEGPGGYDLFYSVWVDGVWSRPVILSGLNTPYDESDLTLLPGNRAVFASNRPGGKGKLDLYISFYTPDEQIEKPSPQQTEISIEALVSEIRTVSQEKINNYPVIPYVFFGGEWPSGFCLPEGGVVNTSPVSFDKLYESSLLTILRRFSESGDASLEVLSQGNLPAPIATKPRVRLTEGSKYKIATPESLWELLGSIEGHERITSGNMPQIQGFSGKFVRFDSRDAKIFEPVSSGAGEVRLEPPLLELGFDARPKTDLAGWDCRLIIGEKEFGSIKSGSNLPAKTIIDLSPFKSELLANDSLAAEIVVSDNSGTKTSRRLAFHIQHTQIEGSQAYRIEDKDYSRYLLFIADDRDLKSASNEWVFRGIQSELPSGQKVIIQYFDNKQPKTKQYAQAVYDRIAALPECRNMPVALSYKNTSDILTFNKVFAPFIIQVLIQR